MLSSRQVEGLQFSGGNPEAKPSLTAQSLVFIYPKGSLPVGPNCLFSLPPKDRVGSNNNYNLNSNNMY